MSDNQEKEMTQNVVEQKEEQAPASSIYVTPPPAYVPPITMYDTKIKENFHIYGVASLLYALLYAVCMFQNGSGLSFLFYILGTIGFIWFCLRKLDMKLGKENAFYIVSMLFLAVSTFCTDDGRIIFFNKLGIFLLTLSMLLGIMHNTKQWNLGKYLGSILQVAVMAIGQIGKPFKDAAWYCKNKINAKNSRYLYLLLGVVITIPFFAVVLGLLTSADAVFRDAALNILAKLNLGNVISFVWMIFFMFLASYGILVYLCKKELKEEVEDTRKWEPLVAIPVASILSALYLIFSVIQILYLFVGNMQLPAGYTYAEYAREGFFQLLAVSILNLILVLVGLYYFRPSKVLKGVLVVMSLCTFIMIASSAMRMMIYIQYYYLTFLRILVLWTLLVLALVFVGVIIYIIRDQFPLFRYSMIVFTCLYIALSFAQPDYWIAKVNVESMKAERSEFFKGDAYDDYSYLAGLSADASSVLVGWADDIGCGLDYYYDSSYPIQTEDKEKLYAYSYLSRLRERVGEPGIWNFNLSRWLADLDVSFKLTEGM
ncbi:MAG: DUF4173 domain-containing protein [Agathobacter sp.]|nr:DUF4173 domain-containing protein [Agathobacter sp.]